MEIQEFFNLIKQKKQTIAVVVILFVLLAVAFTFVQPMRYLSISKMLIVQKPLERVDTYQISRSNEYIASLLTQIITTNSFFKEVLNSGFNIDKKYFPASSDKQIKAWKKTVKVSSDTNGIITIKVFHNNRNQVREIDEAIDFILKTKHQLYHGFGDLVKVKIIEQPVTSDRPVQPNIFINIAMAFVFGILISFSYIYLFPDKKYNLRFTPQTIEMSGDNVRSGQDDLALKENYFEQTTQKTTNNNHIRREKKQQRFNQDNSYFVNASDANKIDTNRKTKNIKNFGERGSMENIIKQVNQRS